MPDESSARPRRTWWVSFGLLFALSGLWALASPLFSVADEPAHVVKAAGTARGQIRGRLVNPGRDATELFRVPVLFDLGHRVADCYKFRPHVPASCAPAFTGSRSPREVVTHLGAYPPAWYLPVGVPSLALPSGTGVLLMRLTAAALSAALLASALCSARDAGPLARGTPGLVAPLALGVALAVTPMALHLAGSVNPSGVEIAAGVGWWAALVALAAGPEAAFPRLAARAAVAGSALVLSRPLAPLWAVLAILAVGAVAGRARVAVLLKERAVRRAGGVLALVSLAALAWIATQHPLRGFAPGLPVAPGSTTAAIVAWSLGQTGDKVRQMIGVFGWLDTSAPLLTFHLWLAGLGLVVLAGLARARRAAMWVLAGLVAATVAVPVALEASQARASGFLWQGRYTLPLAVGVPVLAAALGAPALTALDRRLATVVAVSVGIAHLAAFAWALRRYAVGTSDLLGPLRWSPPAPVPVLLAAFALVTACYGLWLRRLATAGGGPS